MLQHLVLVQENLADFLYLFIYLFIHLFICLFFHLETVTNYSVVFLFIKFQRDSWPRGTAKYAISFKT